MGSQPSGSRMGEAVVCREMTGSDAAAVCALLTAGFAAWRNAQFWTQALDRLARRRVPAGLPRFGYVLEVSGRVVGVLLLIASEWREGEERIRRCNVSSWYVEPDYRIYGTLLVRRALRHRDVTFLNVTPAPETWEILAAQGYERYGGGRAVVLPLLARAAAGVRVTRAEAAGPDLTEAECEIVREHRAWGCLALICDTPRGRVPFIFGLRKRRGVLPFAYLLYCRSAESLVTCARALGVALAWRGIFLVTVDAEGKLPGIPGWFQDGHPKFVRGGKAPRTSDLAYTERAVFGT